MTTEAVIHKPDFRALALVRALMTHGPRHVVLLRRHPDSAHLAQIHGAPKLVDILWDELHALEATRLGRPAAEVLPADRTPIHYWLRRRDLNRLETLLALPPIWVHLLPLPADEARRICIAMGIEAIAWACWGQPPSKLLGLLSPLGSILARRVADRMRRPPSPPRSADLPGRWRTAYQQNAQSRRGNDLAETLGLALLSALFRRLSPRDAASAAALSRSNLCQVVERTPPLDLHDDESIAAEKLADAAMAAVAAHPKETQEP